MDSLPSHSRELRLLERAGFGARPGELEALRAEGCEAWLARQLRPGRDPELERRLARFESLELDVGTMLRSLREEHGLPDTRPAPGTDGSRPAGDAGRKLPESARRELMRQRRTIAAELAGARVVRAVHGHHGLREVMIDFWSNHFSIFGRKTWVAALLPDYQRRVIDPHALGRFEDLLQASARSPAMLVYLDNWRSSAPRSPRRHRRKDDAARRTRSRGGINENYARELLELHTLGVDGGYDQQDVIDVARVFTGWTLADRRDPRFRFRAALHDPGEKTLMGERVPGSGEEQGKALLTWLARHPSTARHVSRKLVVRFVADDPPPALVERAAARFLETEGDIAEVVGLILRSPELVDPQHRKFKTPLRYVASAVRAGGGETDGGRAVLHALARMGEVPWMARTPAGHPDAMLAWLDPGAMLERMAFAFDLSSGALRGTRIEPERAISSREGAISSTKRAISSMDRAISSSKGSISSTQTSFGTAGAGLSPSERAALAIASPEFQWT